MRDGAGRYAGAHVIKVWPLPARRPIRAANGSPMTGSKAATMDHEDAASGRAAAPDHGQAERAARLRRLGVGMVLVSSVAFSFHNNLSRASYGLGVDAITILAFRSILTLAALLLYFAISRRSPLLPRRQTRTVMLLGVVFAAQSFCLLESFAYIPISLAILIFYLFPIVVILLARIVDHESLTPVKMIGAAIAFGGLALTLNVSGGALDWRGIALALAAAGAISVTIMGTTHTMRGVPMISVVTNMLVIVTTIFLIAMVATGGARLPTGGTEDWLIFIAAIACAPVALLCFYLALPLIGGPRVAILMNSEPVVTIAIAVALFGETLAPVQFAGAALVIGAIFLISLYDQRAP